MEAIAASASQRLAVERPAGESLEARFLAADHLADGLGATASARAALQDAVRELSPLDRGAFEPGGHFVLSPVETPWGNRVDVLCASRASTSAPSRAESSLPSTQGVLSATLEARILGLEGRPVYLRAACVPMGASRATTWDVAACAIAYPGLDASGDAVLFQAGDDGSIRVAVVDALGHGDGAARSAEGLIEHLRASRLQPLEHTVATAHERRAAAPRGAALSMFDLDAQGVGRFVGVGNVEPTALGGATRPITRAGTVGVALARLVVDPISVPPGGSLVVATDGFVVRWAAFTLEALAPLPAPLILCALLATATRRTDDATAVVVRRPPTASR